MRLIIRAVLLACAVTALLAQTPVAPLRFEITSVKPTPPERQNKLGLDFCTSSGRYSVAGTPVMWSLRYAYQLKDFQISGAPDWLNGFDSAYDIDGRPSQPVSNDECRLMLQSLFTDRFRLVTHSEMKEAPVYFLGIVKNGTKLHDGGTVRINGAIEVVPPGRPRWPNGLTMSALAGILSNNTDRLVIDRTGLNGTYGITLDFALPDHDGPSIFTAVQEQLGLKLDAARAPVQMLVIDHIQKPDAN